MRILLVPLLLALIPLVARAEDMAEIAMPAAEASSPTPAPLTEADLRAQLHRARYNQLLPADGSRVDVILRLMSGKAFSSEGVQLMAETRFDDATRAAVIDGLQGVYQRGGQHAVDQVGGMLMVLEMPNLTRPQRAALLGQTAISQIALNDTKKRYIPPATWSEESGPVWMTEWDDLVHVIERSRDQRIVNHAGQGLLRLLKLYPDLHARLRDMESAAPKRSIPAQIYGQLLTRSTKLLLERQSEDAFFASLAAAATPVERLGLYAGMHLNTRQSPALLSRLLAHAATVQGDELLALMAASVEIAHYDPPAVLDLLEQHAERIRPAQLDTLLGLTVKLAQVIDAAKLRPLRQHLFAEAGKLGVIPDDPLLLTMLLDDPELAPVLMLWVQQAVDPYVIDIARRLDLPPGKMPGSRAYRRATAQAANRDLAMSLANELTYGSPIWGRDQRFDRTMAVLMASITPHPEMLIARVHRHGHMDADAMASIALQATRSLPCAQHLPILAYISGLQSHYPGLRERLAAMPYGVETPQWVALHYGDWQLAVNNPVEQVDLAAISRAGLKDNVDVLVRSHLHMLDQMGVALPEGALRSNLQMRQKDDFYCSYWSRPDPAATAPP